MLLAVACCMLGCRTVLGFSIGCVPGKLAQSCVMCICAVAVFAWSRFAFASQPQSVFFTRFCEGFRWDAPLQSQVLFEGLFFGMPSFSFARSQHG